MGVYGCFVFSSFNQPGFATKSISQIMSLESNFELVLLPPAVSYHFRQWYDPPPPRSPPVLHSGRLNIPESTPTDITSSISASITTHHRCRDSIGRLLFLLFTQKRFSPDWNIYIYFFLSWIIFAHLQKHNQNQNQSTLLIPGGKLFKRMIIIII